MSEQLTIAQCLGQKTGIVFDTDVLINIWKEEKGERKRETIDLLGRVLHGYRYITVISAYEFLRGTSIPERRDRREWLKEKGLKWIHVSKEVSKLFWNWVVHGIFQGEVPDGLIAAVALSQRFALATHNVGHFGAIQGLILVDDFVKEREAI